MIGSWYFYRICVCTYLVSWHLRTWVHFLSRHEICTNNYILLQFPKETNTSSKNLTPFTPFHTNLQFWLIKRTFHTITWKISCYDFKTILKRFENWCFWTLAAHISSFISMGFLWRYIFLVAHGVQRRT